ncbi:symporter small accessory protein [Methanolobus halotolerans]|uniref:symporter small accessory protein n=1 Tax=Methanolobus halotolerans TaxID=2052935 RepID=UPI0014369CEF
MLGIDDPQIWVAYILCFLSAIGCIIYGALKWNDGQDEEICSTVRASGRSDEEVY